MHICKKCKAEKAKNEMSLWGGAVSEICLDCRAAMKKPKGEPDKPTDPPADKDAEDPRQPAPGPAVSTMDGFKIEVEASFGFSAEILGENLVVTQASSARPEDPDNVTLSRHEAKALFAMFGSWAAST